MDHESFDKLARLLGSAGSRRAALGALFGTGLAGTLAAAEAAKKNRNKNRAKNRKTGKKGKTQVSAQAAPDCSSPGPSSNISGCNYQNDDFSGDNLSSSRMVGTNFRGATLVGTNLSSSNAKGAIFRDANLCGADLRSSTLTNADFRNANLTNADLASSGCGGANFTGARFCNTRTCNGTIRNDGCAGSPSNACCENDDCPGAAACCANACCAAGQVCDTRAPAPDTCCTPGGTCAPASCASVPDLCGGQRECECTGDLECCGTACINTDTDRNNCGACGNACTGCQTCSNGVCSGSGACASWQTCQNGTCTPTCAQQCPGAGCTACYGLFDNSVVCGNFNIHTCDDFVCDAASDCPNPATGDRCVVSSTSKDDNTTEPICASRPGGTCATISPC